MKKLFIFMSTVLLSVMLGASTEAPIYYPNDVENPSTLLEIKEYLIANDEVDGDLTSDIEIIDDNYTGNETVLGDFTIVVQVTDSYNQTTQEMIVVRNTDLSDPQLNLSIDFASVELGDIFTDKLPQATCLDGYQGILTDEIELTGLDTVNVNAYGVNTIYYTCSDGINEVTKPFEIHVVDSFAPVFTGTIEFYKHVEYIATADYFISHLQAYDFKSVYYSDKYNPDVNSETMIDITSDIEILEDGYTGQGDKLGNYIIKVAVTDSFGNRSVQDITIHVLNDISALLVKQPIDDDQEIEMILSTSNEMTVADFTTLLVRLDMVPDETYSSTTHLNTYTEGFDEPGTSAVYRFELISPSGIGEIVKLDIEKVASDIIVHEGSIEWYQAVWNHIKVYYWLDAIGVAILGLLILGSKKPKYGRR